MGLKKKLHPAESATTTTGRLDDGDDTGDVGGDDMNEVDGDVGDGDGDDVDDIGGDFCCHLENLEKPDCRARVTEMQQSWK